MTPGASESCVDLAATMAVQTFNPLEDDRWRAFVRSHPKASVFHRREWLEALQRTYGYEPVVYTTSRADAALTNGIVVCQVRSWLTGRRLVSVPFADHCEPLVERTEDAREIGAVLREAVNREWTYVEIRPRTSGFDEHVPLEPTASFRLHTLNLHPPLPEIAARLHESGIRRKIRRAEREGVSSEAGRSERLLRAFYGLLVLTRRRHSLPPPPLDWFRNLVHCFGPDLAIRVAFKGTHPIGSILTLRHGTTVVYKYGCSDARFHSLGPMPLLFWQVIKEAKEDGAVTLDLGRTDLGNAGLIRFKERLGGVPSAITYRRWSHRRSFSAGWKVQLPRRIFARIPESLLVTAGRLLYRHIG